MSPHESDPIPFDRLPAGFAESIERPPAEPVPARPAATVVLMRDGAPGLEVLLLRRSRINAFVPGAFVFPGGRVDPTDADPQLLGRWTGVEADEAEARLRGEVGADPIPALAYYIAALREAFEETGVLLGRSHDGGDPPPPSDPRIERARSEMAEGRWGFAEALDHLDCTIEGGGVEYIAHWVTPLVEPRRYDTRFFAAAVPAGGEVAVDRTEIDRALWATPESAVAAQRRGELPMVFPTIRTLEDLARFSSAAEVLQAFREERIPRWMPRLVRTPTGLISVLDD